MTDPDRPPDPGAGPESETFRSGFVALAGRANVGKSTLMNRLVGSKLSIVSPVPQTTRFPVRGVLNRRDAQVVFIDTPGIHKPRFRMNREMVRLATRVLRDVDLIGMLVDASEGVGPGDRFALDLVRGSGGRAILILNKIDLMRRERLLPLLAQADGLGLFQDLVPVSALTGENCDRLERVILDRMAPGRPLFPPEMLTDLPERLAVSEIIREQVCLKTRQEVPHATAVMVETLGGERGGLVRIDATIFVERPSQKAILIGEGGRMMKEIGTAARLSLEGFLGSRVHLSLWVKVKERWRDDVSLLRLIGLPLP
ncbi:MAG: GTPase Era [Acidobacteriota bacterium]